MRNFPWMLLAGAAAGIINGLFGAGGGMILVPLLALLADLSDEELFPTSISIMFPICLVSLGISGWANGLPWATALPYLLGSTIGGIAAGLWGKRIPTVWLHRILGLLILWGGIRYIW